MFPTIVPLTKLEAVNIGLSSIGEPQVNSLDGAAVDAQIASSLVDETSRSVQAMGWNWNSERHTLSPDLVGNIVLPSNTLRVDTIDDSAPVDVVQRGLKLFNKADSTYLFDKPLKLEIIVQLVFEEIPFAAKQFVAARASKLLQQRVLGSDTLNAYLKEAEEKAWVALMQDECQTYDGNMLTDSWQTKSIITRSFFTRGGF